MTSVTRREGQRDVHSELQRKGSQDHSLLEVLAKAMREMESNMLAKAVQQDQRLKELSNRQDLQSLATSVRIDKLVQYGISAQVSTMADKYQEHRDNFKRLSKEPLKSATTEDKTDAQKILDQIKKRASKLRTDAEALAKKAGMDPPQ